MVYNFDLQKINSMAFKILSLLLFFAIFIFIDYPIDGKYLLVEVDDMEGKLFISHSYLNNIVINKTFMIKKTISIQIYFLIVIQYNQISYAKCTTLFPK